MFLKNRVRALRKVFFAGIRGWISSETVFLYRIAADDTGAIRSVLDAGKRFRDSMMARVKDIDDRAVFLILVE